MQEKKQESFFHLAKAVEQGFTDFDKIKNTEELLFLKSQSEYPNFVENGFKILVNKSDEDDVSKLERLNQLRKDGALTSTEFEQQKQKILSS